MKKRLLSAALALAMALTLLPMSVFAEAPGTTATGDGSQTATYVDKNNASLGVSGVSDAPGWYAQVKGTGDEANQVRYVKITSGIIYNNKYYSDYGTIHNNGVSSGITVIGSQTIEIGPQVTSLNLDVYGGQSGTTAAITFPSGTNPLLTSITVNDSRYASEGRSQTQRGAVTLPSGWPDADKGMTLSLTNVTCTGSISVSATAKGNVTRSITLNNASLGGATLNGIDGTDMTKLSAQTISLSNGSSIGAISVTGSSSSSVKIADSTASSTIGFTAPGGSVSVSGNSETGKITVDSGDRNDPGKAVTVPSVSVTGTKAGSTTGVAGIERDTADKSTSASSFTVSGGSLISGEIKTHNGSVTVTSSETKAITVANGSVTVNGPTATTGLITVGEDDSGTNKGTVSLKVTGSNNTINGITNNAATLTVDLPADPTNNYGTITDEGSKKYNGHNVKGGTFGDPVPAGWLANTGAGALVYQLEADGDFTYYNGSQLGTALTAQNLGSGNTLTYVGTDTSKDMQTITFKNGKDASGSDIVWGKLKSGGLTPIILPTEVAGVAVSSWFDGQTTYPAGGDYTTAKISVSDDVVLNAQEMSANVSKLLNISAASSAIKESVYVSLVGNVITVSGGVSTENVEGAGIPIEIELYTDINPNTPEDSVMVVYNPTSGSLTFAAGQELGKGMTLEASGSKGLDTLRLSNGTKYTLSGSGIKVLAGELVIDDSNEVVVTANVSGYSGEQNKALAKQLMGIVGTDSKFEWDDSPLMAQAVNAAASVITPSQINSWIDQAQRAAWQAKNTGTLPTDLSVVGGFTTVHLIPYLAVNVTAYNAGGTMTATLTPSYRVVVGPNPTASDNIYKDVFKGKTTGDADGNYIVQTGRALGSLVGELGQVDVALELNTTLGGAYMHQDGNYVYKGTGGKFEITHGSTNGLGTVVLNTTAPMVTLVNADSDESTYDTLQAAVDDTENGDEITVALGYKGSTTINVTGLARKFDVVTEGNHNITSNASGVIVERQKDGKTFTVQLTKDNVVTTNIVVNSAANGTAGASATSVKPGDKVTITLNPNTNYTGSVSAVTNTGASVSMTNNGNNTYTFTVPTGVSSITVTPVFSAKSGLPFTDVSPSDSFYNAVKWNYDNNFVKGTTETTFRPYYNITRAQIVTILYRHAGSPAVSFSVYPYTDMTSDAEMNRAIVWATRNNIVEGYGNGKFGSNNYVRNQELAKILYTYNQYRGKVTTVPTSVDLSSYFTDASSISSWAVPYVKWAVGNGVMGAVSGKQFQPQLQLQRWLVAVDFYNYGLKFGA